MKFLRSGRRVRLWINLDANTPDYKKRITHTVASVLMRRRSLSTPPISEFHWIQRGVDLQCQQSHVAVDTSSRNFGNSTIAPAPNHDSDGEEFSGRAVITSTTIASAKGSPECDDCQKTADCFSCLSISKLRPKSRDRFRCATEGARTPSVRDCETFSGSCPAPCVSAPLAAATTRVRVDPSGDVVMTPTDQAQQGEDANLRKIVAQLHVNLGHPSNDALARAIRLCGGSDDAIQAAFKVRCAEGSVLFLPLHSDVGQSLDTVWRLISS